MSDNLVKFPSGNTNNQVPTPESVTEKVTILRNENVDEITEMLTDEIMSVFEFTGFDSKDPKTDKEMYFIVEAIRSMVSKKLNLEHPFQILAKNSFYENDGNIMFRSPKFSFSGLEEQANADN